jgi:hypothetical protein
MSGIGDECPLMENAPKGMTARLPLNPLLFRFGFSDGTLGQGWSLGRLPAPQIFLSERWIGGRQKKRGGDRKSQSCWRLQNIRRKFCDGFQKNVGANGVKDPAIGVRCRRDHQERRS